MTAEERPLPVGRVGRAHGLDGSFYLEAAAQELAVGDEVLLDGRRMTVDRWAGTAAKPLLRLSGIGDREAASALRGRTVEAVGGREALPEGEWYDDDLVGCRVVGLGEVRAVIHAPSCDLLEVGDDGVLVPLVRDAVRRVDTEAREIEVDIAFLDLEPGEG